jgi:hypothetical protein
LNVVAVSEDSTVAREKNGAVLLDRDEHVLSVNRFWIQFQVEESVI